MGSKHTYPSLTTQGWLKQTISVFDQMLSDFFLSEYSQTFCFKGGVSSFPWILQQYKGDIELVANKTQESLSGYLGTQFNDVIVETSYKQEEDSINRYSLGLFIELSGTDGEKVNLMRLINFDDTKVSSIMKTLTEG